MSDETTPQDGKAMSPASVGSHGDATPLFSERLRMSDAAVEWSNKRKVCAGPFNIVTALFSLGLVAKRPVLTDAETLAIKTALVYLKEDPALPGIAEDKESLRGLLARLG